VSPALLYAIAAGVIFAAGTWTGIRWHAGQDAIAESERLDAIERDRRMAEKRVDTAATSFETDRERLRSDFLVITDRVNDALKSDFYAAGAPGCLDDNGLRELTDAIQSGEAGREPAPAVPRSGEAR